MWTKDNRGFTLLEVMVALVVVSFALVTVSSLRNRDMTYHGEVRHIIRATLLAEEKMTDLEIKIGLPDFGESSARFEAPFEEYEWFQRVIPTPFEFAREVQVDVRWGAKSHESVGLTNYVVSK
jgi:general secretion pathway protein I